MLTEFIGIGAILFAVIFFAYFIIIYNGFIHLKNDMEKSLANIDVLLKQRTDELPNLIASVKGYIKHEKTLLESITMARAAIMGAKTMQEKARANFAISGALRSLFAVAENYPMLKANENYLQLQGRISSLENSIADRREFYNDAVTNYNTRTESFPDMYIAKLFSFQKRELFNVADSEKQNVKANLLSSS